MLQGWKLQLQTSLTISGTIITLSGNYALAQSNIVPDRTLGAESSSVLKPDVNTDEIRGGATRGTNLFHSFEKFSVPTNGIAHFNNAANIQNIITRVTGDSVSNIDGKLKANASANLFLLNPNGIIFGPDASLDIGGSFVASTASSLKFADGTQFSVTEPQIRPLLTVSVPIGLQFGQGVGRIVNRSVVGDTVTLNGEPTPVTFGLQVQPGKTLALVGGDVALEGGHVTAGPSSELVYTAQAGRIELGSVAGPSLVSLTPIEKGWVLGYEGVQNFRDIQLSQTAVVNASASGGGDIQVQGRRISVRDGSFISAYTYGSSSGGTLAVNASESLELGTSSALTNDIFGSGRAGELRINTGKLIVHPGAYVSNITYGFGQGGTLEVAASDSVELSGKSPDGVPSGLFAQTQGPGNAGDLRIETGRLNVRDGAEVNADSAGTGAAGNIAVSAGSIELDNQSSIQATTAVGNQGNITLRSPNLVLRRESQITTNATGTATGGNITIDTDVIAALENSNITANASDGSGGNVKINTQGLFLSPGSQITASSKRGIDGVVEIITFDVDPSSGLVDLPVELVDVTELVVQGCSAGGGTVTTGQSGFIITGRGGLPPTPKEALGSEPALVDLGKPIPAQENNTSVATSITPTSSSPNPIVEAQGWVIGSNGEVVLTATAVTVTPHSPWVTPTNCHPS